MISDENKRNFLLQFGQRVETLKKQKNFTYRQIAQNCDLDHSYISKIAKGEVNITLETILELLKGLDCQPKDLFDFTIHK
jgi:transcriptional regulator with XRE-family HTH domain